MHDKRATPGSSRSWLRPVHTFVAEQYHEHLRAMHQALTGGAVGIYTAICNSPALRNCLIAELQPKRNHLAVIGPVAVEQNLPEIVRAYLKNMPEAKGALVVNSELILPPVPELPQPQAVPKARQSSLLLRAILVPAAEPPPTPLVQPHDPMSAWLGKREEWLSIGVPVIVWLPEYAAETMAQRAPAFWELLDNQFEFVPPRPAIAGIYESRTATPCYDSLKLDTEQKIARLQDLRARLVDAGDPPRRDVARHVPGWQEEAAFLHLELGENTQAAETLKRAAKSLATMGRLSSAATAEITLSLVHLKNNDLLLAEQAALRGLKLNQRLTNGFGEATACATLGTVMRVAGDIEASRQHYRKALVKFKELGCFSNLADALSDAGLLHFDDGDFAGAYERMGKAFEINQRLGRPQAMVAVLLNKGVLHQSQGNLTAAEECFNSAKELALKHDWPEGSAQALLKLGALFEERVERKEALSCWRKAASIYEKLGMADNVRLIEELTSRFKPTKEARGGTNSVIRGRKTTTRMMHG